MNTDEMIAVLQAYKEGKRIQITEQGTDDWRDLPSIGEITTEGRCCGMQWNTIEFDYRIKPEPYYRPFEDFREVMAAIKKYGDWIYYNPYPEVLCKILRFDNFSVKLSSEDPYRYEDALNSLSFADGTPFGVKEEY